MKERANNAEIARALDTRAFYVCPVSILTVPNGRCRPPALRSFIDAEVSVRRGSIEGSITEDIDGDGRICKMRVADPNGPWKKHPQQPSCWSPRTDRPAGR